MARVGQDPSARGPVFSRFPWRLRQAISSRLGWTELRPVQDLAGHALLDGANAVILAPTAGGKTEASVFPLLAGLMDREPEGVGLIYLAPMRALLNNQEERLGTYTEMVGLRRFKWHGDVAEGPKRRFARQPAEVLMTTPESLEVMLLSPRVAHQDLFADLRAVIVDEVHALAGTDRGAHLMAVLERIVRLTANDVQRVGLSATVGNPADILTWLRGTSRRPGEVIDPPKTPSPKDIRIYLRPSLQEIAADAGRMARGHKSLFFCQSRALTEAVADRMRDRGTEVFVHHGSVSREEREQAEELFHRGGAASIICTSTLELGIDVGDLDLVFQANAPSTVSSFLQRMGRTGRRPGKRSNTTFFCEDPEIVLQAAAIVERARQGWVESVHPNGRCWPVLVHQLLALTLQYGAVSPDECWRQLSVLAGRAWIVVHVNHRERTVRVAPAPKGKKPSWGSFSLQLLSFEICQQVAEILTSDQELRYLDPESRSALEAMRKDLGSLLRRPGSSLQMETGRALWWTFAGGRINQTLKLGIRNVQDWAVVADNFRLKIEGTGVSHGAVKEAIDAISAPGFWRDSERLAEISRGLPEYRLSKFQRALPAWCSTEMLSDFLLDIVGTVRFLREAPRPARFRDTLDEGIG
ncbi:MAG: DEAD/DEAH box helicase [Thermoanaerobaculia bacterium]